MNTNIIVKTLMVGFLLGLLSAGSAFSATVMDEAKKQTWEIWNLEGLKTLFADKAAVADFIKNLNPVLEDAGATVCEFILIDLNNDGTVELVATIDVSGRAFCNNIFVVRKSNGIFNTYEINGEGFIKDLKSRIVDINHDNSKEILVPRLLAPYEGAKPIPVINDVYAWDGVGYSKANVYFKDYYRSLLPRLQSELDAVRGGRKLDVPSQKALLEKKYEREIEEVNKILNE